VETKQQFKKWVLDTYKKAPGKWVRKTELYEGFNGKLDLKTITLYLHQWDLIEGVNKSAYCGLELIAPKYDLNDPTSGQAWKAVSCDATEAKLIDIFELHQDFDLDRAKRNLRKIEKWLYELHAYRTAPVKIALALYLKSKEHITQEEACYRADCSKVTLRALIRLLAENGKVSYEKYRGVRAIA